jgi:hypothetical protein
MLCQPKAVCLDTATWGNLGRDSTENRDAQAALKRLQDGRIVPFLTWHHIAELLHHEDDDTVRRRISLLKTLPFVGFLRQPEPHAYVGSILDLRDAEIDCLLSNPALPHLEVINRARPHITNGFESGSQFCSDNEDWWWFYRKHLVPDVLRRQAEISALTHFPNADLSEQVLDTPRQYYIRPIEEAQATFARMAKQLSSRLTRDVKKPLANPDRLATELMREAYEEGLAVYDSSGAGIDSLFKVYDVERSRIPRRATVGDIGEEAVFIKQLSIHERRRDLPANSLRQIIRKEMLPSWLVWRDMDRAIKELRKAESGNLNDKLIVPFGLYIDGIQVDKRMRHYVDQNARKSELLAIIKDRLIRGSSYVDLARDLDSIIAS